MPQTSDPRGLLRGFDQVRIVNLPSRADRRRLVVRELATLGASVDGGTVAFLAAVCPPDAGAFETIGTRGCFLSHLEALRAAHTDGVASLLILEDDVGFARSERSAIPAALAALTAEDWGMFYGGSPIAPAGAPLTRVAPDVPLTLAHFIAFSAPVIDRLVPFLDAMLYRAPGSPEGGPMHVDGAYAWFRRAHPQVQAFAATPHIAHQNASRTDIHELRGLDRVTMLGPLLKAARAGKNMVRRRR